MKRVPDAHHRPAGDMPTLSKVEKDIFWRRVETGPRPYDSTVELLHSPILWVRGVILLQ